MIIGLSGKMGTGKTTVATYLANMLGGRVESFANELRLEIEREFEIPTGSMRDRETKGKLVDLGYKTISIRELMQWWGGVRRQGNRDYWVHKLMSQYGVHDTVIVDDVRYVNEADAILHAGGWVIRINAYAGYVPGSGSEHASETDLDNYKRFTGRFEPDYGGLLNVASIIKDRLEDIKNEPSR